MCYGKLLFISFSQMKFINIIQYTTLRLRLQSIVFENNYIEITRLSCTKYNYKHIMYVYHAFSSNSIII